MDDLFVINSNIAAKGAAERPRSPTPKTDAGTKWEDFRSILERMASGQDWSPPQSIQVDSPAEGDSSAEVEPEKDSRQKEMISVGGHPEGNVEAARGEQIRTEATRLQGERPEVFFEQDESPTVRTVPDQNAPAGTLAQTSLEVMRQTSVNRGIPGEVPALKIDILTTAPGSLIPSETLVRNIAEKDGGSLQMLVGQEGQSLQKGKGRSKGSENVRNLVNGMDHDSRPGENHPVPAGLDGDGGESGEGGRTKGNDLPNALSLNASKKYSVFAEEKGLVAGKTIEKAVDQPSQNTNLQAVQYDVFDTGSHQVREDSAVFEQGSFSSFLQERIEKIVEQYSDRKTGTDMVVRLKLDDQETILVGLKHNNETLLVEVKASNEGLVSLLQSHKGDIERSLEDKNIFTEIYVDPEGERNFEKRDQRGSNARGRRRDGVDGFGVLLDTNA